jgi:hypothetical protein
MSYYETAYPSLLSGVSQQMPQDRLPGHVSEQVNMMSDLVRGLSRRPPVEFLARMPSIAGGDDGDDSIWQVVSVSGTDLLFRFGTNGYNVQVLNPTTGDALPSAITLAAQNYILDADVTQNLPLELRTTTVGPDTYMIVPGHRPTVATAATGYQDPTKAGYFYVLAGGFSIRYELTIRNVTSGIDYTVTYTTPDGTGGTDADLSAPAYIANQLFTAMNTALTTAGIVYTSAISGSYVFYKFSTAELDISSTMSVIYLRTSGRARTKATSELPQKLPSLGDTFTMRVGDDAAVYYRYDNTAVAWVEDAAYNNYSVYNNLCLRLYDNAGTYTLDVVNSERRAAGDADTNPEFAIVSGVTGIGSFKSRLVLLAGQYVCFSAVNKPERWFRSTLTGLSDVDPIEIATSVEFSSDYFAAVEFSGNLLVTSERNQAIVPGDDVLTPRTASIAVVSSYSIAPGVNPVTVGRSVMLPFNRNTGNLGIAEALPPDSLVSPLVATDITAHIPTYIAGSHRFMAANTNADMLVVGAYSDASKETQNKTLYIHQFLWAGVDKVSSAWHRWAFAHSIKYCYFIQDVLYMVFYHGGEVFIGKIQLGRGSIPQYFLDYGFVRTVTPSGSPPFVYVINHPTGYEGLLSTPLGFAAYKLKGLDKDKGEIPTLSQPTPPAYRITPADGKGSDNYACGFLYTSSFQPSPPVFRDRNDEVLANENIILRLFRAHVRNTGLITAQVQDRVFNSGEFDCPIAGVFQLSDFQMGQLRASGAVTIPARTQGADTTLTIKTSDFYDFNMTVLEYGFRLSLKHGRA